MTPLWIALVAIDFSLSQNPVYQTWFKRLANCFVFTGAVCMAFSPEWSATVVPFLFYTIGNLLWVYIAYSLMHRDKPLIELNLFFLAINGFGIVARV